MHLFIKQHDNKKMRGNLKNDQQIRAKVASSYFRKKKTAETDNKQKTAVSGCENQNSTESGFKEDRAPNQCNKFKNCCKIIQKGLYFV